MNWLKKYGFYGLDLIAGLRFTTEGQGAHVAVCHKRSGRLEVCETHTFEDITELESWLKAHPGLPVALFAALPERAEAAVPVDAPDPVSKVMGMKVTQSRDFCWQAWPAGAHFQWVAVTRRQSLEALLERSPLIRPRCVGMCISPVAEAQLLPALPDYQPDQAYCYAEVYGWQEGLMPQTPTEGLLADRDSLAGKLGFAPEFLGPYAAVLEVLQGRTSPLPETAARTRRYALEGQVRRILAGGILAMCLFQMAAWMGEKVLQKASDPLAFEVKGAEPVFQQMEENEQKINQKTAFLQEGLPASRIPFYLDQMAALLPSGIRLELLVFRPTEKEIKKWAPQSTPHLLLKGRAASAGAISSLASAVQSLPFVHHVELLESEWRFQEGDYPFLLSITLTSSSCKPFTPI